MGIFNRPDLTRKRAKSIRESIAALRDRMFPGAKAVRDREAAEKAAREAAEQAEREARRRG